MSGLLPLLVSFYTVDTPYARMAERLRASCDRLGVEHAIVPIASRGSWLANQAAKASVCRSAWQQRGRPILWVDADAVLHARPELLRGATADVAVHRWKGQYFAGGTLWFNQTSTAGRLLDGWVERCADLQDVDQVHLERAWNALQPIDTIWLPRSYCQIFDAPREHEDATVIEHFQASRVQRKAVA